MTYRKASWAPLYGLILLIGAVMVAAWLLGLRGAAEHRLIDVGLAVAAVLAMAWPSLIRRDLLLEDADWAAGACTMRVHEAGKIAWPVEELSGVREGAVSGLTGTD